MKKTRPDPSTALIHHAYEPPGGFVAPQVGVYKASTVIFPNVAALRARNWKSKAGYTYGLHGTPTSFTLEERIATLEGGLQTLLVPMMQQMQRDIAAEVQQAQQAPPAPPAPPAAK